MSKTDKVKATGRFGSRYGVGIRRRVLKIEKTQKKRHKCPSCGFLKSKRMAAGIYVCKKCGAKFSGGAYKPVTISGAIVKKMVTQREFTPHLKELVDAKEHAEEGPESETPTGTEKQIARKEKHLRKRREKDKNEKK